MDGNYLINREYYDIELKSSYYDECINYRYEAENRSVLYHLSIRISKIKAISPYVIWV